MGEDTLRGFAQTLAAKAALAKADAETPEDGLLAIGELLHQAKQDLRGWLEANRHRPQAQAAQPTREKAPSAEEVYLRRREQAGG